MKCVQCGECIVPPSTAQKGAEPTRTGCVLYLDHKYEPEQKKDSRGLFRLLRDILGLR